jgi:formiminoglutamase
MNFEFIPFSNADILALTNVRAGETKLGECVATGISSQAKYILIGVCEDIGPQANHGNPGAKNAFHSALTKLLNMQSNRRYQGNNLAIGGYVKQNCNFTNVEEGRKLVEELDQVLVDVLEPLMRQGQIPILIGGGHNNAFPLIKSHFLAKGKGLEVVNLDPHADCRPLEGRHSGNPFSYANDQGYLSNYTVLGLHSPYNSETILHYLNENEFYYSYFEEYLIRPEKFDSDLNTIAIRSDDYLGIELDMDALKHMPSSAYSPSGFSIEHARKYIMRLASSHRKPAYLHLPEAAPMNESEEKTTSKALAYLVYDFLMTVK